MPLCYRPPGNETLLSWKTSRTTGTAFLLLAALLGLPGNGFVVWSLAGWRPAGGRPLAATLVLHLALADGAVLLLTPFFVAFLTGQAWPLGQAGCKAVYYVCTLSMYASVLLTSLLSLQRCLAVTRPFLAPRLRSPVLAAACCWPSGWPPWFSPSRPPSTATSGRTACASCATRRLPTPPPT